MSPKTKFTKAELVSRALLVCPQLRELGFDQQESFALAGTVQTGPDEYVECNDWEPGTNAQFYDDAVL